MKPLYPWKTTNTTDWEQALSLPALPWTKSFLPLMGLPDAMVEQPLVWERIYSDAMTEYSFRLETRNWEIGVCGGRSRLVQQIFSKAFRELATQLDQQVAV
ncbi:MAG: hypothetical protein HC930_03100 [Hydrococcus sp. SU_1_0]|nr:hypothetical protein [Hydrococcus sp. SU_1_0]